MIVLMTCLVSSMIALLASFLIERKSSKSTDDRILDFTDSGIFLGIIGALAFLSLSGENLHLLSTIDALIIIIFGIGVGPGIFSHLGRKLAYQNKSIDDQ